MDGDSDKQRTEHTPRKCFRCGFEYHLIVKYPKPIEDNKKRKKQVRFSERVNRALQKEYNNVDNHNDQNIYASMSRMSDNDNILSRDFSESSQLTYWILDLGATCHLTPQV